MALALHRHKIRRRVQSRMSRPGRPVRHPHAGLYRARSEGAQVLPRFAVRPLSRWSFPRCRSDRTDTIRPELDVDLLAVGWRPQIASRLLFRTTGACKWTGSPRSNVTERRHPAAWYLQSLSTDPRTAANRAGAPYRTMVQHAVILHSLGRRKSKKSRA